MNILIGTVFLALVAAWVGRRVRAAGQGTEAKARFLRTAAFTLPRMLVALLGAGLLAELVPEGHIEGLFGASAGWRGLLLATVLGPVTPGGAFVSFALGATALKAGAAVGPVMAYVTGWSLFSLTKILAYEMPLMGRRAATLRVAVSWPVPLLLGAVAMAAGWAP